MIQKKSLGSIFIYLLSKRFALNLKEKLDENKRRIHRAVVFA